MIASFLFSCTIEHCKNMADLPSCGVKWPIAELPPLPEELHGAALRNKAFRRVVYTFSGTAAGTAMQITVYRVKTRIPAEIHPNTQTIEVVKGHCGLSLWDDPSTPTPRVTKVGPGQPWIIPAGTKHEVRNESEKGALRIVSFYNPPHDPPGQVDLTYEAGEERAPREAIVQGVQS